MIKRNDILSPREELKNFSIFLDQNPWFSSISVPHDLKKILSNNGKIGDVCKYSLVKFPFKNINLDRHVRPNWVSRLARENEGESRVLLEVACECNYNFDEDNISDPIIMLATKIIIQFDYFLDSNIEDPKTLQCSWHLDKHDPNKGASTSHPLYHYEYGGTEIRKTEGFNYGDFILMDSPRIMHPPLDLVLAFDFVIKNFYTYETHKVLTDDLLYKRYIKNAQYRLWRPYAISFASHFHDFNDIYTIDRAFADNILHCTNKAEIY
ncbi:hypothetical protein [Sediminibacterium goheungense]|uniref:Uncharacterized protein n=1 Tax=Sediminibacterium goheungense TaxID=1086393 RepID=A0A4R6J4K4_9BACT|nr:hypothetical protein [Sediminibacterium goheungense]TDO29226.1 hypothetical protein BC659_1309 [Sediminibacterium goheungense]